MTDGSRHEEVDQHFQQQMNSLYLTDKMHFLYDRLTIGGGIKYIMISRDQGNNTPGAVRYGTGTYSQPLPQVSISYKLTPHEQIYVNGTTAFRAPASLQAYGQFFQPIAPFLLTSYTKLKGEYSIEEKIGYRYYGLFNFSVALFNYNITNNQVYTSPQPGSLFLPRVLQLRGQDVTWRAGGIRAAPLASLQSICLRAIPTCNDGFQLRRHQHSRPTGISANSRGKSQYRIRNSRRQSDWPMMTVISSGYLAVVTSLVGNTDFGIDFIQQKGSALMTSAL